MVAPLAGAWIETSTSGNAVGQTNVAPLAGAWIETLKVQKKVISHYRRAPRGRVD